MGLGTWVAINGIDAWSVAAARDLLLRHAPTGRAAAWCAPAGAREADLDAAKLLGSGTPLFGPRHPGTARLGQDVHWRPHDRRAGARAGKVGVTANSHKVIGNLLDGSLRRPRDEPHLTVRMAKSRGRNQPNCQAATHIQGCQPRGGPR